MRWNYDKKIKGAALALRDDKALYAELLQTDGGYSIVNAEAFELPAGFIEEDHIKDPERLGVFLRKKCAFRWGKLPFVLGIPSSDCIFRNFSLPAADLSEARESMRWCFSDFFPYEYDDALYDLCEIPDVAGLQMIGVACEKKVVMPVLEALKNFRCLVQAVEPSCVACARAFSSNDAVKSSLLVAGIGNVVHLIFFKDGTAVLFRSLPLDHTRTENVATRIDDEIRRTLEYVMEQFHESDIQLHLVGNLPRKVSLIANASWLEAENFQVLKFISPADADWLDVAGLLLRYQGENRI